MKVFWDTNLFIYLIEQHQAFYPKVIALYKRHRDQNDTIVTSTLTLGELLAQPLRNGQPGLAPKYVSLLTTPAIGLVPFDQSAAEYYARIRAETSLRQPDAIQLACSAACGATIFITNDQRLWGLTVPGIETICGL